MCIGNQAKLSGAVLIQGVNTTLNIPGGASGLGQNLEL